MVKPIRFQRLNLHPHLFYWDAPRVVSIELTNKCNLRCSHCFRRFYSFPQGEASVEDIVKLAQEARAYGVESLNLSGSGEPFMFSEFERVVSSLKSMGVTLSTTTNGTFIARRMEAVKLFDCVYVSLDAVNTRVHLLRRGIPSSSVVKNILELRRKGVDINLGFITVLNSENVHELCSIVRLAGRVSAGCIYVYHQIFYNDTSFRKYSLFFRREKYDKHLKRAISLAKSLGVELVHPGTFDGSISPHPAISDYLERKDRSFFCKWIFNSLGVTWNGYYQACCFVDRLLMGKRSSEDIKEVWNGPAYRKLRLSFLKGVIPDECKNCLFLQSVLPDTESSYVCPHFESNFYNDKALFAKETTELSFKDVNQKYELGLGALLSGELERAVSLFESIVNIEPVFFEASNALAVCLFLLGLRDSALRVLESAEFVDDIMKENLRIIKGL